MEAALSGRDVAAVIMETIPATYGFPMPADGYLPAVKALCERYGAFYIADEVQTGLMRTGQMWAITGYGVTPDILVTAKGISGGLYTLGCVLVSEETGAWLHEDGFGHISTGGGAELGCLVALKVLEICQRPEVQANVHAQTSLWAERLRAIQALHPDFFTGIRQNGLVMGLEFDHPEGAKHVMRALYQNGVWAIFSTLDPARAAMEARPAPDPGSCATTCWSGWSARSAKQKPRHMVRTGPTRFMAAGTPPPGPTAHLRSHLADMEAWPRAMHTDPTGAEVSVPDRLAADQPLYAACARRGSLRDLRPATSFTVGAPALAMECATAPVTVGFLPKLDTDPYFQVAKLGAEEAMGGACQLHGADQRVMLEKLEAAVDGVG